MIREDFLKSVWSPYPPASNDWLDVRDFLKIPRKGSSQVVAGRLRMATSGWILESGGASLEFAFATEPALEWLQPSSLKIPASASLFASGDLVAVSVSPDKQTETLIAKQVLLLAPGGESSTTAFSVATSRQWASFIDHIRHFFVDKDFIEARTPTLVASPGTEPYLDPFSTEWVVGSRAKTVYLPTSPEFHLKQLLVSGWTKIFEFKDCFRNGEVGDHHQPEFLMLEWYRAYANLDQIADDVDHLLQSLASRFSQSVSPLRRITVRDLFRDAFSGFDLKPTTTRDDLFALAQAHGLSSTVDDSFDDIFFRLFLDRIEPHLGQQGPVLVSHYPPSQAALSRIGEHGFAERFEIYWKGLELANAFHELNDPKANERRFEDDARRKREIQKPAVPRDENLVRALHTGLPPSGGIALGVDRLFMALFGIREIASTRAFPAALEES